jgi:hypothetical protein
MNGKKEEAMGVSRRNYIAVGVALLVALVLAFPAFARPDRASIDLSRTCQVGSSSIQAGTYKVVLDTNKVSFLLNGKLVAEATGEWKKADTPSDYTSVTYDQNGRVTQIHLRGRDSYFAIQ